jgi:deoxyribodipyrimidine photo-lyase
MQMSKRAHSNHALNEAIRIANERRLPLVVYEGLKYNYPWASDRFHAFIMEGVNEKREAFAKKGIKYLFYLQKNEKSPKNTVAQLAKDAVLLITDDYPCFIIPKHNRTIADKASIPVYAVDSNGVIPMSRFEKEEYAAYTIRPKINRMIDEYLTPLKDESVVVRADKLTMDCPDTVFEDQEIPSLVSACDIDHSVGISRFYRGGTKAGKARLKRFIGEILKDYGTARNKPERDGSSRLSAYIHFGFLSAIEIALLAKNADAPKESKDAFLEELIVRRELSFNFTRFNEKYDSLECLPNWVQQTMRDHIDDDRQYLYSLEQLEAAETHDELWNAAQREMVETGGMHNYVRMLWGKNVIAWTKSYEEAFSILEHLNNKYCLDGRDPNSYAGILWCFGKHDRPWMERPVFGTMRYMTSGSTGKKFDSKKYIQWTKGLIQNSLF